MTLLLVDRYIDPQDRPVLRFHAPSSTTPGKVYVVDYLEGTDVWSCGPLSGEDRDKCEASRYKKTCRHIPNWRKPPEAVASKLLAEGDSPLSPGQFDEATAENILTIREKIRKYADESVTFRRFVIERQSGPIIVYLLARYFGFQIHVPSDESVESYLAGLPQFSTIRTASLDVLKAAQAANEEGWEDDGSREERHLAYRRFYGKQAEGQQTFEVGA